MSNNKSDNGSRGIFSWVPFWIAGSLFTLGYVGLDVSFAAAKWWQQMLALGVMFWTWPLILGMSLGQ